MVIYGKHPVICALNSGFKVDKVLIYQNLKEKDKIVNLCKTKDVSYEIVKKHKIDQLVKHEEHQGICAYLSHDLTCKVSENINNFLLNNTNIMLILDRIQDPHNLGSIIRTAQILNVKNIISTYNKSSKITPSVVKASSGSIFYIKFSYSDNLKRIIEILKNNKVFVYSLERGGVFIENLEVINNKVALIVGSEHYGVRESLINMSHKIITLRQLNNQVNSYNVSNAVSIALYLLTIKSL